MHHHAGVHIGDPEVILILRPIAQAPDTLDGGLLRLLQGQFPGLHLAVIIPENAPRGIGQLGHHLALAVEEALFHCGDEEREDQGDEDADDQQGGEDDAQEEPAPIDAGRLGRR